MPLVLSIPAPFRDLICCETLSGSVDSCVEPAQTGNPVLLSTTHSLDFPLGMHSINFDQTRVGLVCGMPDLLFHGGCVGGEITAANQIQGHCESLGPP